MKPLPAEWLLPGTWATLVPERALGLEPVPEKELVKVLVRVPVTVPGMVPVMAKGPVTVPEQEPAERNRSSKPA